MLGAEDVRFINHNSQEFSSSDGELGTMANSLICYLSFSEQPARWRFVVNFYRLKEVHYLVFGHISLSDPKFQCFQPPLAAFPLPKIHPSNDIIRQTLKTVLSQPVLSAKAQKCHSDTGCSLALSFYLTDVETG